MIKLNQLYSLCQSDIMIKSIKIDANEVNYGDLFVCISNSSYDGHDYITKAINNGAIAVVVSKNISNSDAFIIRVPDTNRELPYLCQKFYNYPDKAMKMIGVSGSLGKTSTSSIIQTLIGSNLCGFIGTNRKCCASYTSYNKETTNSSKLYGDLNEFRGYSCKYAVIEESKNLLDSDSLQATEYDVSCFTNIFNDYLGSSEDVTKYIASLLKLFKQTKSNGFCILNRDDKFFNIFKENSKGNILTYGRNLESDLVIVSNKNYLTHTEIEFKYKDNNFSVTSPLIGDFNIYNLAGAILTCLSLSIDLETIINRIKLINVPGRMEFLRTNSNYYVMIDYCRCPDSINSLLSSIRSLDVNKIITVIGNDKYPKREDIISAVIKGSDYSIFSYNNYLLKENEKYSVIASRGEAIKYAIDMANDKDIVLILGMGDGVDEENKFFNDKNEAYNYLAGRNIREGVVN